MARVGAHGAEHLRDWEAEEHQVECEIEDQRHGAGASIGAGVRVPIIKWISVAIGFDYSFIALYVGGTSISTGEDSFTGAFALTVHPI